MNNLYYNKWRLSFEGRHLFFIDIILNIALLLKSYCIFEIGWRNSTQRHIEFKKRLKKEKL